MVRRPKVEQKPDQSTLWVFEGRQSKARLATAAEVMMVAARLPWPKGKRGRYEKPEEPEPKGMK